MIARALVIALWSVYAMALAPLTVPTDDDCALYLTGPGRSSAFDYSLNLLKGNFGYDGQHICITYDAINQAYLDARNRILVAQPKGDWKPEDFASVGELVLDISIQLARTYGLTYEEIEKGLPLIDTSRTLIREVCPPVFSHVECRAGKYRRLDGLCNNLQHPTWGATMAPFQRLIGPLFADGINAPRISHTGRDLPLSRVVSRTMHPDEGFHDHAGTVMVIAWGQFMDHDYTLTGTPLDPVHRNDPEECCKRPLHLKHPYCNEIQIPGDDYFYRLFGVKCIDFVRGFPSPRPGCRLGSRTPFNTLTGVIDGNTVYGVTDKFSRKLRTGYGGLLRMNPVFKEYGLKDLLPLKLDIPDEGCTRPNKNMYCFEAGEIRVNEQLVLAVMHTLMAREHNRVAEALAAVNSHWDDETLFQEARRINIAEIQHITYNEFLPILLGKDVMEKFGLVLEKQGYWDGYDPSVNPDVLASFAAAAYRFGHSLLPTAVERWSKAHKFIASKRLSDLIRRPYDLYRAGVLDEYVMGLMNQVAQAMDDSITQEVTNHLFKKVGARFGMDLVSFNMQRGREFGLPGYMEFRKFCGLSGAETFQELFGAMPNETVRKYESIFEHPIDVDLWSGGVSERPLPGSMLGPTFACIIATQFSYSRRGDRFWFEMPNQPSSFTPEQLSEIRKSRLARIICDNTDIIDTVQLYPMVLPDHELNPRVPCRSGIIPQMDFSKWADPLPFHGPAKQFITDAIVSMGENVTNTIEDLLEIFNKKNITENNCEVSNDTIKKENNNCIGTILSLTDNPTANLTNKKLLFNLTDDPILDKSNNNLNSSIYESNKNRKIFNSHNSAESLIKECLNEVNITDIPCIPHSKNISEVTDDDKLLKYIYNINNTITEPQKSDIGYSKNNLSRKKRSVALTNFTSNINHNYEEVPKSQAYNTYQNKNREELLLPITDNGNILKSSNLADFSIETLHNDAVESNNPEQTDEKSIENTKDHEENTKKINTYPEVDKIIEYNGIKQYRNIVRNYSKGNENRERDNFEIYIPKYNLSRNESDKNEETNNFSKYPENEESEESFTLQPRQIKSNLKVESNENNYESTENNTELSTKTNESYQNNSKNNADLNSPKHQYVNLEDFSHTKKDFNNKDVSKTTQDTHEDYSGPSPGKLETSTSSNEDKNSSNDQYSRSENKHNNEQTKFHDEAIKPVIDLNNENIESNREIANDHLNTKHENSEKLSPISAVNENIDVQKGNENVLESAENARKVDVKKQFERIPLDYNHAKAEIKEENDHTERSKTEHPSQTTTKISESEEEESEGTLDTISAVDEKLDDELNIKFDDLTIKLPEIKLPDDILSYNYEEPVYGTKIQNNNQKLYYYNDEENSGKLKNKEKSVEDDNDYFNYYAKENEYNNDNNNAKLRKDENDESENDESEDDESEDLYEKFVRERFGRDSYKKRSEKVQQDPRLKNPKLHSTVQDILIKTENVEKQAKKSGDPNARYMWTLEYGENL